MNPAERAGELTQQHIDGILSPAGREELEALLRDHPDARAAYLRELRLHAALRAGDAAGARAALAAGGCDVTTSRSLGLVHLAG